MSKREAAIQLLSQYKNMRFGDKLFGGQISMEEIIELLKQSESEERTAETAQNVPNDDLISRKAAIEIANDIRDCIFVEGYWAWMERLKRLPSVQPTQNSTESTQTNAENLIDRQAAIKVVEKHYRIDNDLLEVIAYEIERLPSAQPEQQWIPCERELPEVGRSVLISVGGMYTAEGCLREDGDWSQFRWQAIQKKSHVTAWMPLPEPWRGEEHD